jgi:peroxiredoxin
MPAHAQAPKVGDKAPDFSVISSTSKPVALGDYLGKKNIVLFFYIAAFTDT